MFILYSYYQSFDYSGMDGANIIAISKDFNKLVEALKKEIEEQTKYYDFVMDDECNIEDIKEGEYIRLFYHKQENWDCYIEYKIEKKKEGF